METRREEGVHCEGKTDQMSREPVTDLWRSVPRSNRVVVYYQDLKGQYDMMELSGEEAHCIQHFSDVFNCKWKCANERKEKSKDEKPKEKEKAVKEEEPLLDDEEDTGPRRKW
jgi:hypothetical protein